FVPERDLAFEFEVPENAPGVGGLLESGGVEEKRIGSPDEGHTVDLIVGFDEWRIAKPRRKLRIRGNFCEIKRRGESGVDDRRGDVAGRGDDVVVRGTATAEFGDEFVAGAHVGGDDLAVMCFFKGLDERGISVALPNEEAERLLSLPAGGTNQSHSDRKE